MEPITGAIISGGLNILGGMAQNAAIEKAATRQYNANKLWIERDQSVAYENVLFQGDEVNRELGMQLTQLGQEGTRAVARTTATSAETNVYGNTAARLQGMARMKEALAEDNLIQAAEAKMTDVQSKLSQVKYDTEARHVQNAQSYNNMMSQQQSTFSMLAGGIGAGISGYSQTQSMNLANKQLALMG